MSIAKELKMNLIITLLSSHLLTVLENELLANEPAIVAMIEQEIQLLINKLEAFLESKQPVVAKVVNPALDVANKALDAGVEAGAVAVLGVAQGGK